MKAVIQRIRPVLVSFSLSALIVVIGLYFLPDLDAQKIVRRLLWPILRLMSLIGMGLVVAQLIEATGWSRVLGGVAKPVFNFANLGPLCSAAFTTAFFSGVAANAMLLNFYQEGKIRRNQLFLANFINQFPAFFLHLPTTFFIIIPLTRWAGIFYLALTLAAALLRTVVFVLYGRLHPSFRSDPPSDALAPDFAGRPKRRSGVWKEIRRKIPGRILGIGIYVVPVYLLVFVLHGMGFFTAARDWLARVMVQAVLPVEALSVVIFSFAAEFASGFAAAGALMDAGVLTTKETVMALLIGNIVAFPVRALRHQLPRYVGIFSPRMGTQLLLMGQGFRVLSLIGVGAVYYLAS